MDLEAIQEFMETTFMPGAWSFFLGLLIIFVFIAFKGVLSKLVYLLALILFPRSRPQISESIFPAFASPLRSFFIFLGIFLALRYLPELTESQEILLTSVFRTIIVILVGWGFYNLSGESSHFLSNLKQKFNLNMDDIVVTFISKVLRFIVIVLVFTIIAREWGFDISGVIAGLGLGGLAIALAAQNAISNLFGGIIIITERPFTIGDWIATPNVEGVVEDISFRSTRVRTFAKGLVTIPNALLASEAITNWSEMGKRRITFNLGVTYTTPRQKIESCIKKIEKMLEDHPDVDNELIFVRFAGFNDSSLDIFLYFFTKSVKWDEHLKAKQNINFKIMEILEEEGVSVAFPSRSIYFENPMPQE